MDGALRSSDLPQEEEVGTQLAAPLPDIPDYMFGDRPVQPLLLRVSGFPELWLMSLSLLQVLQGGCQGRCSTILEEREKEMEEDGWSAIAILATFLLVFTGIRREPGFTRVLLQGKGPHSTD